MSRKALSPLHSRLLLICCLTFVIGVLPATPGPAGSGVALAEPDGKTAAGISQDTSAPSEAKENIERIRSRVQQLQAEIAEIRNQALDKNPELEKMLKRLVLTRKEIMENHLDQENVDLQRLEEIGNQLQDDGIPPEKTKALKQEQKRIVLSYRLAENRTAQDETLQELRKNFYTELMKAAKKENPDAEKMLDELNMLRHQLQLANPATISDGQQ